MAGPSRSKTERHARLLGQGFFPEELPPPFVSKDMSETRRLLLSDFKKIPQNPKADPWHLTFRSTPEVINFPRHAKQDRRLSIINPISYFYLSREISENWVEIKKHIVKSKASLSKPVFDWEGSRAFLKPDFSGWHKALSKIAIDHEYIVHLDVLRFYHSIYTHSIAWALHTKPIAKKNRSTALLGNRLDMLCRNSQDGQTVGIPVGPDTSRIISEIIGVALDRALALKNSGKQDVTFRFVDDISIGAISPYEAEKLKNISRVIANQFELELNEEKTLIENAKSIDYAAWRHEIAKKLPHRDSPIIEYEIFFYFVNQLAKLYPKQSIPNYAIKRARSVFINTKHWSITEDFLILCYRSYPDVIPVVVEILTNRKFRYSDVSLLKMEKFISSNVGRLVNHRKTGELSWFLFLAKALSITLKTKDLLDIFDLPSSVNALLVCDLEQAGLIKGKINKKFWNLSLSSDGLRSDMWLYAYEASLKGWTGQSDAFCKSDQFFKVFFDRKVSFYDVKKNIQRFETKIQNEIRAQIMQRAAFAQGLEEVGREKEKDGLPDWVLQMQFSDSDYEDPMRYE